MKQIYLLIFIVMTGIITACLLNRKFTIHNKKSRALVKSILVITIVGLIENCIIMFSANVQVLKWAYSIFFITTDLIILLYFFFCVNFTGRKCNWKSVMILSLIIIADILSMMANPVTEHAFSYGYKVALGGGNHFTYIGKWPHYLHLIISYILVIASIILLFTRERKVSQIEKVKYQTMYLMMLFVVIVYFINLAAGSVIDISMLLCAMGAVITYFFATDYLTNALLKHSLYSVTDEMKEGILLYNSEFECIYSNSSAKKMFTEEERAQVLMFPKLQEYLTATQYKAIEDFVYDYDKFIDGNIAHLRVSFNCITDVAGCFMGCFFSIIDRTDEEIKLKKVLDEMKYDKLTGLYNRDYFEKRVKEIILANEKEEYYIITSLVSNFQFYNDIFGVITGDSILNEVANVIKDNVKLPAVSARLRGDNFAILVRKSQYSEERFQKLTERLSVRGNNTEYPIKLYIGVYEIDDRELPISVMCDKANLAINTLKEADGANIAYYSADIRAKMLKDQKIMSDVEKGIENDEFIIFLQPQFTPDNNSLGAEALVRWNHPTNGFIVPGEFIPVIEKNGIISKLDRHIWELACIQLKKWKDQGKDNYYISINISPKDFYYMDVCDILCGFVDKYEISPSNLKLEITETAIVQNMERQERFIESLHKKGFLIEMDDFGSGYSSLSMLRDIKVDVLKVDMAFLGETKQEIRSRNILTNVIRMAKDLEMPVIIEGVETEEQVEFLISIGADLFQGYYFSKPISVEEYEEKYM